MSPTFEDVKVGDRVYSLRFGWGSVSSFCYTGSDTFYVNFDNVSVGNYLRTGFIYGLLDLNRDLYWDIPQVIVPEKPKKKVKKTRWYHAKINESGTLYFVYPYSEFDNKEEALRIGKKFCYETVQIEYDVEE